MVKQFWVFGQYIYIYIHIYIHIYTDIHTHIYGVCAQLCLILCDSMDCRPPGSSVHGIFQARILGWVAIFLLQRIFPTQGWNPPHLHWQTDSLALGPWEAKRALRVHTHTNTHTIKLVNQSIAPFFFPSLFKGFYYKKPLCLKGKQYKNISTKKGLRILSWDYHNP